MRRNFSNRSPDGCCSPLAIGRLRTAIGYAKDHGQVLDDELYTVGAYGGRYLALCGLMNDIEGIAGYEIWEPISDLAAWHDKTRGTRYAAEVHARTGSPDRLYIGEAHRRSPLHMKAPSHSRPTRIYAGIRDGLQGSVPISQCVRMYNRLAEHLGSPRTRSRTPNFSTLWRTEARRFIPDTGSFNRHRSGRRGM